ncbi:hypothetical protein ACFX2K_032736 [Malus domestica]
MVRATHWNRLQAASANKAAIRRSFKTRCSGRGNQNATQTRGRGPLQSLAQLHTAAHHRGKTVIKRHYTAKPRCSIWHIHDLLPRPYKFREDPGVKLRLLNIRDS